MSELYEVLLPLTLEFFVGLSERHLQKGGPCFTRRFTAEKGALAWEREGEGEGSLLKFEDEAAAAKFDLIVSALRDALSFVRELLGKTREEFFQEFVFEKDSEKEPDFGYFPWAKDGAHIKEILAQAVWVEMPEERKKSLYWKGSCFRIFEAGVKGVSPFIPLSRVPYWATISFFSDHNKFMTIPEVAVEEPYLLSTDRIYLVAQEVGRRWTLEYLLFDREICLGRCPRLSPILYTGLGLGNLADLMEPIRVKKK